MFRYLLIPGLGISLGSCAVYVPLIPPTPVLTEAGQAEVSGHLNMGASLDGNIAYSPLKHVLLTAGGSTWHDKQDTSYFRQRQFEVGLGGYHAFPNGSYVGIIGGYGQGRAVRGFQETEVASPWLLLPVPTELVEYRGRYHKYFLQAYVMEDLVPDASKNVLQVGANVRRVWLDMYQLTRNGLPYTHAATAYLEGELLMRVGSKALQGQLAVGFSAPNRMETNPRLTSISRNSIIVGLGVVLHPHALRRKSALE